MKKTTSHQGKPKYFDRLGRYVLQDFDHKQPFSSFLPGIAGLQGIPMWVFYVNRGQAVCSFGTENKDHPILEFQAANKAYQTTSLSGFRTFLNGDSDGQRWMREAFSPWDAHDSQRKMFIGMNEVEIQEVNNHLGYQINVQYFMLPNMPFSGLVRRVRIRNLHGHTINLEVLDGLPTIVPYGVDDDSLKGMGRTIEAWMKVDNLENNLPFYRLKATPGDTTEVHAIQAGHYALAYYKDQRLPAIADPNVIFGRDTSHSKAHLFHDQGLMKVFEAQQILEGRSLCGFFGTSMTIEPGEVHEINSIYGYAKSLSHIASSADTLGASGHIDQKLREARTLTDELTDAIRTESASPNFDGYCRQTFLDNLLRGGYPLVLGKKNIYHVFSHKHGDIERDYNYFITTPEFYSQGNGNFRDINQNRRNDVFFVPEAGEFNIRLFMSLIQADGYNPLEFNGVDFTMPPDQIDGLLAYTNNKDSLAQVLRGSYTPGQLLEAVIMAETIIPIEDFLEKVMSQAELHIRAEHGEGYWIDHWTYNLDLIETYLAIYPDRRSDLLFHSTPLPFFDSAYIVQPREVRYVLSHGKPRQLNAIVEDLEKAALISSRREHPNWVRSNQGKGDLFRLPLFSKMALLTLIKFSTRDPSGMGIQMEAGKPGWYDALNGLPALFGSSLPETYELLRLIHFLIEVLEETPQSVSLPIEAQILLEGIEEVSGIELDAFKTWDRVSDALEAYRESIRLGFDGKTISVRLDSMLLDMRESLERGINQASSMTAGVPPTYIIHEVTDYNLTGKKDINGCPHIRVTGFKPVALPPFLEGPVHQLKISDVQSAQDLDRIVKSSGLFDKKLGMYKVNAPLSDQPHEIGRTRAFTPGWLENESIFMHMAFKYLLELLKVGLYDEFFTALKIHLPAFMQPDVYGRSPLENSSFIASSAHPDPSLHGNGFVARLTGSTAEFLSMWTLMTAGKKPFRVENDHLVLEFKPVLPGWLFKENGSFTFRFLGSCDVTLINVLQKDTYTEGLEIKEIKLHASDTVINIDGAVIGKPYAERVRLGEFNLIECFYE